MLNEDVVKNINKLNNERNNINLELSKKANKEHKHNVSDIEGLTIVANAEDINYTNASKEDIENSKQALDTLFTDIEANKKSILDIENLKEVDNIKCNTDTGEYTIENSKKGYLTNFNIQGKTLVNLANPNNVYTTDGVRYNNPFRYIESGKTYTFVNLCDKQIKYTYGGIGDITIPPYSNVLYTIPNTNITVSEIMCYGHTSDGWEETDADKQKISKAMLVLEGHYTIEDIEYVEYFDGLQSVGQEYNMELFSCKEDINIIPNNITWKDGYFLNRNDNLEYESKHYSYTLDYIPVKADTDYTLIYANWNILLYDKDKNIINFGYPNPSMSINGLGDKISEGLFFIKTTSNSCYMRISVPTRCKDRITISEGIKFDKKIIPYTLRSLPSGVGDEIIYKDNKYHLIKRCEENILNGNETWGTHTSIERTNTIVFATSKGIINSNGDTCILNSDKFKPVSANILANCDYECIANGGNTGYETMIRISKTKASSLENFKTWLKSNNITVIYPLQTPKEIELNTLNLEQYNNQTKIICNSAIVPSISFESTQNLGSHIEVIRETLKEVFQSGVNAKNNVVTTLNSKGVDVATNDTWEEIKDKIDKKEGRLDLREAMLSNSSPYLVMNGTIKYIEKCSGNFKTLEYEEPYFYVIKETHLIKINAIDETVVFDITLANANFSCICITQEFLFISDNNKLYKINKVTGSEIQSIEGAYYKLCAYGDYVYGVYGNETSSILHKIRISDMYKMLTKDMSINSIYDFEGGKFACNRNAIYATTEHSNSSGSTVCYLTKINFDFSVSKELRLGGYLYEKNIKFLNDFVFVSERDRGIEVENNKKSGLVKYDANLNVIAYAEMYTHRNFDIHNGYIYALNINSTSSFQKLDLNLKVINGYSKLGYALPNDDMIIINNLVFFINGGIYRNVLAKEIYSDEKGELL
ncbi:hypothetical protein ACQZQJ_11280 [Clostridioides difficile]|nr:hypothetical protein [Clostridioides difficile]MDE3595243.1 hypothetical protein [Clostridioides difficile]MDI3041141.1 hypothetical protein [Clostridioides difficile]MDS6446361.1 hypothetical protein [Clostridioides difficile]VHU51441.1 Uncharacterised protein [Clostridioides difficile]